MKQQRYFLMALLAIVFSFSTVNACINGFDENYAASLHYSLKTHPVPSGHPVDTKDADVLYNYEKMLAGYKKGDFKYSVDYCLFLIYDKKYEEAEKACRIVAQKFPNKYEPAANLGTILEVNGKFEEALKWIKKGMEIDPTSHKGSEWVHVKILEAKLNPANKWTGSSLTGVDFGQNGLANSGKSKAELKKLQSDLFYQLNERVTFIKPKDPFIAALMFELGNATFELGDKKNAKKIYQSAQKYGFAAPLLKERMDALSPSKDASYEADSVALDTIVPPANIELDTATKPDTIVESLSPAAITKSDPPKSKYTLVLIAVLAIAGAIGSYLYGKRIMKKK